MSVITRFAPSPTGYLHVGNIRTALICWLYARQQQGKFILRLDDTDQVRSTEEFSSSIGKDLTWLGLNWDDFFKQSDRRAEYDVHIARLKEQGRLYACYETAEELSLKRKALLNQGKPPIYDRGALKLSDAEKQKLEADGRTPHWRFKMLDQPVDWDDLVRGPVHFEGRDISDPVLIREDGTPLYHLCSVIDDVDTGVTHIVRGEDHVANTAAHIQMFEALGAKPPQFAHLALLSGADGDKLSKRIGSLSMRQLQKEEGIEPMAVLSLLGKLGSSDPIRLYTSLDELVADFDFAKFSRSSARLDALDIERLNMHYLAQLDYADAAPRLEKLELGAIDEILWNAIRGNLKRMDEARLWLDIVSQPVTPLIEEKDYLGEAAQCLPANLNAQSWTEWTGALKEKTGRKGKALFMPLRKALTGLDHGPEMNIILERIGYDRASKRLQGITT